LILRQRVLYSTNCLQAAEAQAAVGHVAELAVGPQVNAAMAAEVDNAASNVAEVIARPLRPYGLYFDKMLSIVKYHAVDVENVFEVVESLVETLIRQHCPPCKFIIGISRDPQHRYSNSMYGYKTGRMFVLRRALGPASASELETLLISRFKGTGGCCNQKPGGEGIAKMSSAASSASMNLDFVYTYVVFSVHLLPEQNQSPDAYQRLSRIPWSRAPRKQLRVACESW
jgi:hypothetical protein